MAYLVKEIFGPTIQGEGMHAGASCVFLRFAVCNLACSWCDTDFSEDGAERLESEDIASRLLETDTCGSRLVIVTGGEPTLQWDAAVCESIKAAGFAIHMESNGTRPLAAPVDWLTISPKPQFHDGRFHLAQAACTQADECKVVVDPSVDLQTLDRYRGQYQCENWFLQPCMDDDYDRSLATTLELIRERPQWRLSLQLHKLIGVP
ncbi:MAG: 7-carboxy-7-deazaguanine synthase QueE [Deltaproteobacteria bacterium]|nr:7-carboxy-7-deazaguanine synthase QueE [Deltaproteobacteria bacterium]